MDAAANATVAHSALLVSGLASTSVINSTPMDTDDIQAATLRANILRFSNQPSQRPDSSLRLPTGLTYSLSIPSASEPDVSSTCMHTGVLGAGNVQLLRQPRLMISASEFEQRMAALQQLYQRECSNLALSYQQAHHQLTSQHQQYQLQLLTEFASQQQQQQLQRATLFEEATAAAAAAESTPPNNNGLVFAPQKTHGLVCPVVPPLRSAAAPLHVANSREQLDQLSAAMAATDVGSAASTRPIGVSQKLQKSVVVGEATEVQSNAELLIRTQSQRQLRKISEGSTPESPQQASPPSAQVHHGLSRTVSVETKNRLRMMLYQKQKQQSKTKGNASAQLLSSSRDEALLQMDQPHTASFLVPDNLFTYEDDRDLRKTSSEPNLKMKSKLALRSKLLNRASPLHSSPPVQGSSCKSNTTRDSLILPTQQQKSSAEEMARSSAFAPLSAADRVQGATLPRADPMPLPPVSLYDTIRLQPMHQTGDFSTLLNPSPSEPNLATVSLGAIQQQSVNLQSLLYPATNRMEQDPYASLLLNAILLQQQNALGVQPNTDR